MRDVAFVEMGQSWYRLIVYLDDEPSAGDPSTGSPSTGDPSIGVATRLRSSMESPLTDSNVRPEVVTVGKNATEESLKHLQTLGIQSHPSAVLVSPEGRVRRIPLAAQTSPQSLPQSPPRGDETAEALQRNIQSAIDSVVRSPRRNAILSELMTAHSLVLIIESKDQAQNLLAKSMVENAIGRIEATLPDLPKPIDVPPRVMIISPEEAQREAIMLWSLGVDVDVDVNVNVDDDDDSDSDSENDIHTNSERATQIAMVFGRGRKLGSVMDVTEIGELDLLRTLAVVGLDCECDLDRSWMQAPMFPHAWTEADESQAVKSLGFDPGHPLVKVEISRILSRGPSSLESDGQIASSNAAADMLLPGLQIIELNFDDEETVVETKTAASGSETAAQAESSADIVSASETGNRKSASNVVSSELGAADNTPIGSIPIDNNSIDSAPVNGSPVADDPTDPSRREPAASSTVAETAADSSATSTLPVVSAALMGLVILGLLGGALVLFSGRRNGP